MTEQQTLLWESGQSSAPLPPLVDTGDREQDEHMMVTLYRNYGPIFRLTRPGKEPLTVLAGPQANVFMARHEDEFLTSRSHQPAFKRAILTWRLPSGRVV